MARPHVAQKIEKLVIAQRFQLSRVREAFDFALARSAQGPHRSDGVILTYHHGTDPSRMESAGEEGLYAKGPWTYEVAFAKDDD